MKTEKQTKGGGTGASRKKTTDNKNSASTNANNTDTVNQAFDESAVDNSFNGDLLPLDGKEDIGDLLEVFDGNDSFHDMDMIKTENAASSKSASKKVCTFARIDYKLYLYCFFILVLQRGRSTKDKAGDDGAGAEDGSAAGGAAAVAANPPKKKSKKST